MPSHLDFNVEFKRQPTAQPQARRLRPVLAWLLLTASVVSLLWMNMDFGRYALTGLFWARGQGTVESLRETSKPTIQFVTSDGTVHRFTEDYILLCGGRHSFCWIRNFDPGQVVPVVFDAAVPEQAFVDDWALRAGCLTWLMLAGILACLAGAIPLVLRGGSFRASLRIAGRE